MNPDFSERQFETAVNIELSTALGPHMSPAIPLVPTTNQEAREGWDALLKLGSGYWYFLQYKVAFSASRRTHWNTKFWDVHNRPYFRFPLHVASTGECKQHRRLEELRVTQPGVYYCVPAFVKEEELWERVANQSVLGGSQLLDVADLPLPDYEGSHQVSFDNRGLLQVWSERGEKSMDDRDPSIRRSQINRRQVDRETVGALLTDAARVAGRSMRARSSRIYDAWLEARFEGTARTDTPEDPAEGFVEGLDAGELLATTSRMLQLDFGLTWVIDPG